MPLNENFLQELKYKTDIEDIISTYVTLRKRGNTSVGLCPFHNEKTPSFTVYNDTQSFYCFGCGAGGDAIGFIKKIENLDYIDAVKMLAERAGMQMPQDGFDDSLSKKRRRILEINRETAKFYHSYMMSPEGKVGYDYFINRGLSPKTITKFGLGYAPDNWDSLLKHLRSLGFSYGEMLDAGVIKESKNNRFFDFFRNRVITPVINVRGNVIAFGGRVLDDSKPKYLNSSDTLVYKKTNELFALNLAKDSTSDTLILCEGYMDVIALHQAGFDNAVASLGTALTSGHANLLKRYTKNVYLTYDSDGAGVKAALRAIPILKEVGITTKVINMKPYKDPDEFIKALGAEEYQKRIDTAENSFMFEIRILEQQYDMHDPESKTKFYNAVAEKLCTFGEKLERDNYIAAVADKYMIGIEDLRRLVNQYGAKIGMAAGGAPPVRERSELRREQGSEKKKENGMIQSQKLLLTWLIEHTGLFPKIEKYISPEDFTEEIYHKAAEILYEQYRNTGTVNPAKIVSMFQNEEEQREIAGLFHATIRGVETEGDKENGGYSKETFEKALKETIVRVKQNSIEYHLKNMAPTDMAALQRSVADKKALEELEKVHISID